MLRFSGIRVFHFIYKESEWAQLSGLLPLLSLIPENANHFSSYPEKKEFK